MTYNVFGGTLNLTQPTTSTWGTGRSSVWPVVSAAVSEPIRDALRLSAVQIIIYFTVHELL